LSLTLFLTTLRHINIGDEITIAYTSPYLPFFRRRADLKRLFGFDCTCEWCIQILSHSQESFLFIEESDTAREFLTTFWDSYPPFETWCMNPGIYAEDFLISAHKKALAMIEREGLQVLSSLQHSRAQWPTYDDEVPTPDVIRHTDGIALCYGVLSDPVNFQKWVARALNARLGHSGSGMAGGLDAWIVRRRHGNEGEARCCDADVRRELEKWIGNPETFPAWGGRGESNQILCRLR
jgi:hypothetical protein